VPDPARAPAAAPVDYSCLAFVEDLGNSRILVVGGAGFIGSHVVDLLLGEPVARVTVLDNFVRGRREHLPDDPRVVVRTGSILDRAAVGDAMAGADLVLHLAALWLGECLHDPRAALEVNVTGTFNVAEAAVAAGVQRVVYSSSASVYGDALAVPMTEEHPFNNRTMYGATKLAGEQILRALNDQHGLDYVALRYFNAYGPRMDDKGVYVSVIARALDRLDAGLAPVVFGDGTQAYDFIHVADIARANVLALTADVGDAAYNVATGVRTSIADLIAMLVEVSGVPLAPEFRPGERSLVTQRVGGTDAAERDLGFTARIALRDGLRDLVDWRRRRPLAA
jgi:UDP-glucose 4-epimerase